MNPISKTARRLSAWGMACLATVIITMTARAHIHPPHLGDAGPITISGEGRANPYPSQIVTSNILGTIEKVVIQLDNVSHTFPDDLDILLVGPNGDSVVLMSDVGGQIDLNNVNLTIDDSGASFPNETAISTGTYKPTDVDDTGDSVDTFPDANTSNTGAALSVFNGDNPNGTWRLYVVDDQEADSGSIGLWSLTVYTTPIVAVTNPAVTINEDTSTNVNIFVNDTDNDPATLTISGTIPSGQTNVVHPSGLSFGGSGTNRTLTITPRPHASGTAVITVGVSDGRATITTNITVTVVPVNDGPSGTIETNKITIVQGTLSAPVDLELSDRDTDEANLILTATSSNPSVVANHNVFFGGSGEDRTVRIAPNGAAVGTSEVTINIIDATDTNNRLTNSSQKITVTVNEASHEVFGNPTAITINDNTTATPYGSPITVSNVSGLIGEITVVLADFNHTKPEDVDVLLVKEGGDAVLLMRNAGGTLDVSNARLTFDQDAATPIPAGTQLATGTYRPADNAPGAGGNFAPPAPAGTAGVYSVNLDDYVGDNANGVWRLYVRDAQSGDTGLIEGGWLLNIYPAPTITDISNKTTAEDTAFTVNFTVDDSDGSVTNVTATSSDTTLFTVSRTFNAETGASSVTVTPVANRVGTGTVTIVARDNSGFDATETFSVTITAVNDAPTMAVIDKQVTRAGEPVGPIDVVINDVESDESALVVTASSSNTKILPNSNIVLEGNGSTRTMSLYPVGNETGLVTVTVRVTDPQGLFNERSFELTVREPASPLFGNNAAITINDNTTASPYPSTITVSNLIGTVSDVRITLNSLSHPAPDDIDILLVGPNGDQVVLMSDVGNAGGLTNAQLRIFDGATNAFPDEGVITSGEYRPTNSGGGDPFPGAPAGTPDAALSTFDGINPNGAWRLYVLDDSSGARGGIITGGWQLSIRTSPQIADIADQQTTEDTAKRVGITIGDEQPGVDLTVTATESGSPDVVHSIVIEGEGAQRTLTITPVANASGTNLITVSVSDGTTTDTETFNFGVTPVDDAPTISAISDKTTPAATRIGPITFTVSDPETANAQNIGLTVTSSDQTLIPNSNITVTRRDGGGTVDLSILPAGVQTGTATITITATDSTGKKDTEEFDLTVTRNVAFANSGAIIINDNTTASPYPSTLNVQGVQGQVSGVRVVLQGFTHTYPDDVDILLVSPTGAKSMLMSDAGGATAANNLRLDFSADAGTPVPDSTALTSRSYVPANYEGENSEGVDQFPAPAPSGAAAANLNAFVGINPNGEWKLFVKDDIFSEDGVIQNGWLLIIETGPTISSVAPQSTPEDQTITVPFTISDSDTVATNLTVTPTISGNSTPNLVVSSNVVILGTGNERSVRITPTANLSGTNLITLTVTDGETSESTSFPLSVLSRNDAPIITTATNAVTKVEDTTFTISYNVTDVDSNISPTNITVRSLNPALIPNSTNNITVATGGTDRDATVTVTLRPATHQTGTGDIELVVADRYSTNAPADSVTNIVTVTITPANDVPTIGGITNQTLFVGQAGGGTNVNFTVDDVETPARNLAVTAFSRNENLVPNENIILGGSGADRTIQVTTIGTSADSAEIGVVVSDGTASRTNFFTVQTTASPATTFANTSIITIRDTNTANPYPSTITVSDLTGPVHSVSVTLDGFRHTAPDDVDIVLVGPDGQQVTLLSDAGGRNAVNNLRLRFEERGVTPPDDSPLTSQTYAASNYEGADAFPGLNTTGASTSLTAFDGRQANGTWSLYVVDDTATDSGAIEFGWTLTVTTAPTITLLTPTPITFAEDTTGSFVIELADEVTPTTGLALDFTSSNTRLLPRSGITTTTNGNQVTVTLDTAPNESGTNNLTVVVRRSDGAQSSIVVPMNVTPVNDPQTISRITDKTTGEGQPLTFEFLISDVDTALSNLWLEATSDNTTVIANTNLLLYGQTNQVRGLPRELVSFTLQPNANATGPAEITITLTDTNSGFAVSTNFTLNVTPFNDAPTISSIPSQTIEADQSTTNILFTVRDADNDPLTVTATSDNAALIQSIVLSDEADDSSGDRRGIRVTANPGVEGSAVITVVAKDPGGKSATTKFTVTVRPSRERLYSNTRVITINDNGPATEYPSEITISDLAGRITKVEVTLNKFAHTFPSDVDVLLVSPSGDKVVLMSDAGNGSAVTNLNIKFDQTAAQAVSETTLTSGSFRPANYEGSTDPFAAPAPAGPYSSDLNSFNGDLANGTWRLFIVDDTGSDAGVVSGGWTLAITTEPRILNLADLTINEGETGRVDFTIAEETFGSTNFTFEVIVGNTSLIPTNGIVITGSGTNYTAVVTPFENASGKSTNTVRVTNADGQVVTDQFIVTVIPQNDAPTITDIADQTITAGTTSPAIAFNYDDVETDKKDLDLTVQSSNPALIPVGNIDIVGNELRITPEGNQTGSSTITITVSDGSASRSTEFVVTVVPASNPLFANTDGVTINDNGAATPYPSVIQVSGVQGTVTKVTVTLTGLSHPYPDDVDVLLVGPEGQKVILMSDAGAGGTEQSSLEDARIAFDDAAANNLPDNGAITNGTYKPTNYEGSDTFRTGAPAGPYSATLSAFVGGNPNGAWSLYIQDDAAPDAGSLDGWLLSIATTAGNTTISDIPDQTVGEDENVEVTFTVNSPSADPSVTATASNTNLVSSTRVSGTGANRTLNLTLVPEASGTSAITVVVSDAFGSDSETFNLTVTNVNDAPVMATIADQSATAGETVSIPLQVSDVDTALTNLVFSGLPSNTNLVEGVTFDVTSRGVTAILDLASGVTGNSFVTIIVRDGENRVSDTFVLTVTPANQPPTLAPIADQTTRVNTPVTVALNITDSDTALTDLEFRAVPSNTNLVQSVTFNATSTGVTMTVTPGTNETGSSFITVIVRDGQNTVSDTFTFTVPENQPPTLAPIADQTTPAGTPVTVALNITDSDTALTDLEFRAVPSNTNLVQSVTFNATSTGVTMTVTPGTNQTGSAFITVIVRDGGNTVSDTFTFTVLENRPPTLAPIADQTTTRNTPITITLNVTDPDTALTDLTFSAAPSNRELVPNVTFNVTDSTVTATIDVGTNVTGTAFITITVKDGQNTASDTFTLNVTEPSGEAATLAIALDGSNVNIDVTGTVGATYVIEGTDNFVTWGDVATVTIDSDGTSRVVLPTNNRMMFFRARVQ